MKAKKSVYVISLELDDQPLRVVTVYGNRKAVYSFISSLFDRYLSVLKYHHYSYIDDAGLSLQDCDYIL